MLTFLFFSLIFTLSTFVIVLIDFFKVPINNIHQISVLLIFILFIAINLQRFLPTNILSGKGKWIFLFITSATIQLIVLYTGALISPFFVLYYLFVIGLIFLFDYKISLLFLATAALNLAIHWITNPYVLPTDDAYGILLFYVSSFLTIIPLVTNLSDRYHFRDKVFSLLDTQISVEESILADVNELIFATDRDLQILSVNSTAQQALLKNQTELIEKPLFEVLFLKNNNGQILSKDYPQIKEMLTQKKNIVITDLLILATATTLRKVNLHINPIVSPGKEIEQISFIVSDQNPDAQGKRNWQQTLERAQLKQDAIIEKLKQTLISSGQKELALQLALASKLSQDIHFITTIETNGITEQKEHVDIASISKQAINSEQELAHSFGVELTLDIPYSDLKKLFPLFPIYGSLPELPTGPFYTVLGDVNYLSLLFHKLLEMSIILSSPQKSPHITLRIERQDTEIIIHIEGPCQEFSKSEKSDIFTPYYGTLGNTDMFQLGSGLEGYIAKILADYLNIPLQIHFTSDPTKYEIVLQFQKENSPLARSALSGAEK